MAVHCREEKYKIGIQINTLHVPLANSVRRIIRSFLNGEIKIVKKAAELQAKQQKKKK